MAQPSDLPPPRTIDSAAGSAHRLLYQGYVTHRLHIGMKGNLNSRRSPVHNIWENIVPYALILLMIVNYSYTMGWQGFVLTVSLGIGVGLFVIPRWIMIKVRKRAVARAFASADGWDELWRFGGLSMRLADDPAIVCDSPDGDWQAFALAHLGTAGASAV